VFSIGQIHQIQDGQNCYSTGNGAVKGEHDCVWKHSDRGAAIGVGRKQLGREGRSLALARGAGVGLQA